MGQNKEALSNTERGLSLTYSRHILITNPTFCAKIAFLSQLSFLTQTAAHLELNKRNEAMKSHKKMKQNEFIHMLTGNILNEYEKNVKKISNKNK